MTPATADASLVAPVAPPVDPGEAPSRLARLARSAAVRARVPTIAYASFDRETAEVGVVRADPAAKPLAAETTFHAASIGKTIIGVCVMQLVEERRLSLDADVSEYVGFPVRAPSAPAVPVTLRHLLTHTAALRDDYPRLEASERFTLEAFLRTYVQEDAFGLEAPGTLRRYSNVGAALAALAVERAYGRPWDEIARAQVFEPLGMASARYQRERAVHPASDLWVSAPDLARFGRAMLGRGRLGDVRVLREATFATMVKRTKPGDALGWQVTKLGPHAVVGHEGEDRAASTALYLDLERGVGAVLLADGDAFRSGDRERIDALGELELALLDAAVAIQKPRAP